MTMQHTTMLTALIKSNRKKLRWKQLHFVQASLVKAKETLSSLEPIQDNSSSSLDDESSSLLF